MIEGMSSQGSLFAMFDKTNSKSNELKNPIVWPGCPKSLFCDIYFIRILICNAMTLLMMIHTKRRYHTLTQGIRILFKYKERCC